ncbi:hypothetical protein ACF1CG_34765 [Streptomyces sp. NPDC014773]|uniref:hypothetical protein n=1 Tax=Streptomyces sp. NPDC014773 TaxID=3364908 RepID=UPI0036F900C5
MNSTDVPRPVFLPSGPSWNAQARLVGEVLHTVAAAAARLLDDTRYLVPALTWQVAADQVRDCVTVDHHRDRLRILLLPAHVLEAIWSCRTALARTTGHDDDAERLAGLLDSSTRSTASACLACWTPWTRSSRSSPSTCLPPAPWPLASH